MGRAQRAIRRRRCHPYLWIDPLEISSSGSEVNGGPTALIIDQAESFGAFINFDIVVAAWK